MKRKSKNQRTCKVCNAKKDKSELIRIYLDPKEEKPVLRYGINENTSHIKRGMYICKDINCIKKLEIKHIKNGFKTNNLNNLDIEKVINEIIIKLH